MKLFLNFNTGQISSLQCTQHSFCSERDRIRWLEKRRSYQVLVALKNETFNQIPMPISTSSVNRWHNYLCYDYQSAAFLMENDSESWQIACLWNGNDINGTCAPAPSNNKPIAYIEPQKWRKMLYKFRKSIGCTSRAVWEAGKAQELYICSERCLHGGIGYMSVLLISVTLMISITLFLILHAFYFAEHSILNVDQWTFFFKHCSVLYNIAARNTNRGILCSDSLVCSEHHRFRMSDVLCKGQSEGFMINKRSDRWPIRCLWNGDAMNDTCAPAPPSNLSIFYITSNEWQRKIKEFRIKIGCNAMDIKNVNKLYNIINRKISCHEQTCECLKLGELHICKERCIQSGIGYTPSLFMMTTLIASVMLLLIIQTK
uniref:C-type lectin domain-containing protein n=1 Tax=Elaeophora elaphi TaxID=1147741 RepID=A0A0R3RU18_9BILA